MRENIFITGAPRSGTTLLDKILNSHPRVCIGSQPFPYLFYKTKEIFNQEKNIKSSGYPLTPLFRENDYEQNDFLEFLGTRVLTAKEIKRIFDDMKGYTGCLTPGIQNYVNRIKQGTFIGIFRQLTELIGEIFHRPGVYFIGTKEAFCEEYIPFFLHNHVKTIIIIRDPRDVLASMNFGKGSDYVGKPLPTLYILRNWRKSVAFALAFKDNPDFMFIRYEDITKEPVKTINSLTTFLKIAPFDKVEFKNGIIDQNGKPWVGNSSFGPHKIINKNSVGRFKGLMSIETIKYIESICYPEFLALDYDLYACNSFDENIIMNFREKFAGARTKIEANYSSIPLHVEEEIKRFKMLFLNPSQVEKRIWFIYPKVYDYLKSVIERCPIAK